MAFKTDEGERLDDIKRQALTVLRSVAYDNGSGEPDIEGPLWALVDVSFGSEAVKNACQWFRVAAAYTEDEELRRMLCIEAYGKIERVLRCYIA